MAEEVVQPRKRAGDNSLGFVPRPAFTQYRFGDAADKQRPKQRGFRLMKQQIAMMLAVRRQCRVEHQLQHRAGLLGIAESGTAGRKLIEFRNQRIAGCAPRLTRGHIGRFNGTPKCVQAAEKLRIAGAGRKIEIAQNLLQTGLISKFDRRFHGHNSVSGGKNSSGNGAV